MHIALKSAACVETGMCNGHILLFPGKGFFFFCRRSSYTGKLRHPGTSQRSFVVVISTVFCFFCFFFFSLQRNVFQVIEMSHILSTLTNKLKSQLLLTNTVS